ncbi:hypothetical protein PVAP13_9KG230852 [Panicum virgatum]|uniref:Aminotransferase-like plant mobile domain-containing protein n=1 Tax=Panicum virgatum TaxID=38727 RepID=A0A8T0NJM9_PANVG|nr:hypothetical protein PVAP13_9KG230852 [Panicum virgatum]
MDEAVPPLRPYRMSLAGVAQLQPFEPSTDATANPILKELQYTEGDFNLKNPDRTWRSGPNFIARCFYPLASISQSNVASTLGNRIVNGNFSWVNFRLEGWICSLGKYFISPPLIKATLERWDPHTNTFLFPWGERTITLLDMLKMAGLPLEGDSYDEFFPPSADLDPILLLYPKSSSLLMKIWNQLAENGKVSFQGWCDYFYHSPDHHEPADLYVAAFLALWICCFVVVGGGPYIRPSVLVMASWMALGRRYALAQPALCSFCYSLRLISMGVVRPTSPKRLWPLHYLVGWMGVYLPNILGRKMRNLRLPVCPYPTVRPTMLITMSRNPKSFSMQEARAFMVATFKKDFCIMEPYHPERVAKQFRLDQLVPYTPLSDLVTEDNVGMAYAHWANLLRLVPEDFHFTPDDYRVGRNTLAWVRWFSKFMAPFTSILDTLTKDKQPCDHNKDDDIRRDYHAHPGLIPRDLSSHDFAVVQRVSILNKAHHVSSVKAKAERVNGPWKKILYELLNGRINMDTEADRSPEPVLVDNMLAYENLADNQISASREGNRKRRPTQAATSDQAEGSKAKRKLILDDAGEDSTNSVPLAISDEVSVSAFLAEPQDDDHDDPADFALLGIEGIPKPLPFIDPSIPSIDAAGSSQGQSKSPSIVTQIHTPAVEASEINAFINESGQQELEGLSSREAAPISEATQSMDATLEQLCLENANRMLAKVLAGLDVDNLKESSRCSDLQLASICIPENFTSTSKIKNMLNQLIILSKKLQQVHSEFEETSKQEDPAIGEAKRTLAAKQEALEATNQELISAKETLARLNAVLQEAEQKEKQLQQTWTSQDLEVKELDRQLRDITAKANQQVADKLQTKSASLQDEAAQLLASLNPFGGSSST